MQGSGDFQLKSGKRSTWKGSCRRNSSKKSTDRFQPAMPKNFFQKFLFSPGKHPNIYN